ncbi:MAG: hypothetical protein ACYDEY_16270, partial [Acidimicrobiales bacterium]
NPNPYPVVLMERVDATVHITPCSSNMAPDAPIMVNHRGAQQLSVVGEQATDHLGCAAFDA